MLDPAGSGEYISIPTFIGEYDGNRYNISAEYIEDDLSYWEWTIDIQPIGGGSSDSDVEWLHLPIYNYNYDSATGNYTLDDSLVVTELHVPVNKNTGECIYGDLETLIENTSDVNVGFTVAGSNVQYIGPSVYLTPGKNCLGVLNFSSVTTSPGALPGEIPMDLLIEGIGQITMGALVFVMMQE